MKRTFWVSLIAGGMMLGGLSLPAAAQETQAGTTVGAFYRWYIAHHGRVAKIWNEVRGLFDADLFDLIGGEYFKGDYKDDAISVSPCNNAMSTCKPVQYDLFANARSPATSYAIGATRIEKSQASVSVTLRLSNNIRSQSHVTVILHSSGGRYVISNLLFGERRYYYVRAIVDLKNFLGDYSC
jgi:hypothetical protein